MTQFILSLFQLDFLWETKVPGSKTCTRRRRSSAGSPLGSPRHKTSSEKPHSWFNQTRNKGTDFLHNILTCIIDLLVTVVYYQQWKVCVCVCIVFLTLFKCAVTQFFHFLDDKFQGFCCAKFHFLPGVMSRWIMFLCHHPHMTQAPLLLGIYLSSYLKLNGIN